MWRVLRSSLKSVAQYSMRQFSEAAYMSLKMVWPPSGGTLPSKRKGQVFGNAVSPSSLWKRMIAAALGATAAGNAEAQNPPLLATRDQQDAANATELAPG
jgi:hypothetical protein